MGFADDVVEVRGKMDILLEAVDLLTPDILDGMRKLGSIDWDEAEKIRKAINKINKDRTKIMTVHNGLGDIERVVEMQNQIHNVSDTRNSIGLVAGNIKRVTALADDLVLLDEIHDMNDDIKNILLMKKQIESVLDLDEKINSASRLSDKIDDSIEELSGIENNVRRMLQDSVNSLNEVKIREKSINEKLNEIRDIRDSMVDLGIDVIHLDPESKPYSIYERKGNVLRLGIPSGKQGVRGEKGERGIQGKPGIPGTATNQGKQGNPGRDGKNFKIDIYGSVKDLGRYGNRPTGTSLLALDENPVMIYFKKSDAKGDWSLGQPFGISDGEKANITVLDSQRVGGYTVDQLLLFIQKKLQEVLDGRST